MNAIKIASLITLLGILRLPASEAGLRLRVNDSEEYKLRLELLENMDIMVRPVKSYSEAVNVSFSLIVRSLSDLENKRQMLITSIWISQKWHNPFLEWDKNKYGGIDRIHVRPTEIWVPDIILYNNGDNKVFQAGHTELFKTWVVLQSNGICTWDSPANVESECDIDISLFPFDKQNCSFFFGSATYGSELLAIHSMPPKEHAIIESDSNGEWHIVRTFEDVYHKQRYPNDTRKYWFIKFTLEIQRKWMYYVMFLILPCVICTLLVLVGFAIPPENGERIGFCSTIMIAVSVFLLIISEMLPEKSDTLPILGVYYTITMMEIAFALVATILVLRAYHSTSEPPACFKALYQACKAKKKKKFESKLKINPKNFFKRNAVNSEITQVENEAAAVSMPPTASCGPENKPIMESSDELSDEDNRKIWRSIAVSFDRFFFWVFLLVFLGSSGYLIMIRPVIDLNKTSL